MAAPPCADGKAQRVLSRRSMPIYGRVQRAYSAPLLRVWWRTRPDGAACLDRHRIGRSGASRACRPASCRSRIRAISSSSCNCRTAQRWSARKRRFEQISTIARADPGVEHVVAIAGVSATQRQRARWPMPASPTSCQGVGTRRADLTHAVRPFDVRRWRRCRRAGYRAAAAADPGNRQCRRFQHAGGTARRQHRLRQAAKRRRDAIVANAQAQSGLAACRRRSAPAGAADTHRVDRVKARNAARFGRSVFSTLATYLGSTYVVQFNRFGRVFQVYAQADAQFRQRPARYRQSLGTQPAGQHNSAGTLVEIVPIVGPPLISLYNLYPVVERSSVLPAPARSGDALRPDGPGRRADLAARQRRRMDRDVVSGKDRRPGDVSRLPPWPCCWFISSSPRNTELVHAAVGDPLGAACACRSGPCSQRAAHPTTTCTPRSELSCSWRSRPRTPF